MKKLLAATMFAAVLTGCLGTAKPFGKGAADAGKAAPSLKTEAAMAKNLPLVLPDTITEQNQKQKMQALADELASDRQSGGRAYVEAARK